MENAEEYLARILQFGDEMPHTYQAEDFTLSYFSRTKRTFCEFLDGHFVLYLEGGGTNFVEYDALSHSYISPYREMFGIVCSDNVEQADRRLYEAA